MTWASVVTVLHRLSVSDGPILLCKQEVVGSSPIASTGPADRPSVAATSENPVLNWTRREPPSSEADVEAGVSLDALPSFGLPCQLKRAPTLHLNRELRDVLGDRRPKNRRVDAVIDVGNENPVARMSSHGTSGIAVRTSSGSFPATSPIRLMTASAASRKSRSLSHAS
jgi:hypothetical protein